MNISKDTVTASGLAGVGGAAALHFAAESATEYFSGMAVQYIKSAAAVPLASKILFSGSICALALKVHEFASDLLNKTRLKDSPIPKTIACVVIDLSVCAAATYVLAPVVGLSFAVAAMVNGVALTILAAAKFLSSHFAQAPVSTITPPTTHEVEAHKGLKKVLSEVEALRKDAAAAKEDAAAVKEMVENLLEPQIKAQKEAANIEVKIAPLGKELRERFLGKEEFDEYIADLKERVERKEDGAVQELVDFFNLLVELRDLDDQLGFVTGDLGDSILTEETREIIYPLGDPQKILDGLTDTLQANGVDKAKIEELLAYQSPHGRAPRAAGEKGRPGTPVALGPVPAASKGGPDGRGGPNLPRPLPTPGSASDSTDRSESRTGSTDESTDESGSTDDSGSYESTSRSSEDSDDDSSE